MTCFSDTFCIGGELLDAGVAAALWLDYIGISVLGEQWQPLTPQIEATFDTVQRVVGLLLKGGTSPCESTLAASQVNV